MSATSPGQPASSVAHRLLLVFGVSALAGLLVAGLAFPLVGGLGVLARTGADSFEDLPTDLAAPPLPQRSRILADDGKTVIATIYLNENRIVVPLTDVPDLTRKALIAIEDARFYSHGGVDLRGIVRAALTDASSGAIEQGASTLTQQYVKNVLIEKATTAEGKKLARADTLSRKLREARYAVALENKLTKNQILERYFNIAYYGNGVYGIGTAAQHYYGKSVGDLDLQESAMLAGMVQNPSGYDPTAHPKAATARRNTVLAHMRNLGYITAAQATAAMAAPLGLHVSAVDNGCGGSFAAYFCQWLLQEAQDDPAFGATADERVARLFQGGLTITTTLDPRVQFAAQKAVDKAIPPTDPSGVATAAVVVEPGTGRVLAMAQDRRYGADEAPGFTKVNYATGGITGFQAGSTFKAFVLAQALKEGIPLSTTFVAPSCYVSAVFEEPESGCYHNAGDSEAGTYSIPQATWRSVNTFFVQLEERVGVLKAARLAQAMGLTTLPLGTSALTAKSGSFTLGTYEVSPLQMADAYATLAAHGVHCSPTAIIKVADSDGELVAAPKPTCDRVLEAGVADTVTSVLQGVIDGPDPLRTGAVASIGRPAAGKTGTTQSFGAAWFVGYTPGLATAVWVGNPKGGAAHPLLGVTIDGRYYPHIYGATLAAPIWQKIMSLAVAGEPVVPFAGANATVAGGKHVAVPDVVGQDPATAQAALAAAGLAARVSDTPIDRADVAAGLVGQSSPPAGSSVPVGTTVTLYPSTGVAPPELPAATGTPTPVVGSPSTGPGQPGPQPPGNGDGGRGRGNDHGPGKKG